MMNANNRIRLLFDCSKVKVKKSNNNLWYVQALITCSRSWWFFQSLCQYYTCNVQNAPLPTVWLRLSHCVPRKSPLSSLAGLLGSLPDEQMVLDSS